MRLLSHPVFQLNKSRALSLLFIIAPLLNFLFGISIDMYTPALPEITKYFGTTYFDSHRTTNSFMFGFAIGCFILGALIDVYGTRRVLIFSLLSFACLSLIILLADKIGLLTLLRFSQGFCAAAFSVSSRVIIFKNYTGKKYNAGIIYTSLAYALGVIISPFFGSAMLFFFSWHSIFIIYTIFSGLLFFLYLLFIPSTSLPNDEVALKKSILKYLHISYDKTFLSSSILLGMVAFQLMSFSILMPSIFHHKLNLPTYYFGYYSTPVGLFYLIGTLVNRAMIKNACVIDICTKGFYLLGFSLFIYLIVSVLTNDSVGSIVIPTLLIVFSTGFIIPSLVGTSLKLFPKNIGVTAGAQSMIFMLVCTVITSIAIRLHFETQLNIGFYYIAIYSLEVVLYFKYLLPKIK